MQAVQLVDFQHDPELREVAEPEPAPGEVVVRVGGAGACHSDLHVMHDYPAGLLPWKIPFTLGHENAGWVHALGANVTGLEVGRPVAVYGPWGCGHCDRCRVGAENYCDNAATIPYAGGGLGRDGGMAPFLLVPDARLLVPLGDIDPVDAAPLTDAGLTPYHAIARSLPRLRAGSTTLVIGAGGLGHLAVQILGEVCATTVVVVDQRDEALQHAASVGAHQTVAAGPDAPAQIFEITRGRGTDLVLDLVGTNDTIALGMGVARADSDVTIVGMAGGNFPFSAFSQRYGVSIGSTYWGTRPELVELLALAEAGRVHAHVQRFALADAPRAYAALAAGELTGRAVIVPD